MLTRYSVGLALGTLAGLFLSVNAQAQTGVAVRVAAPVVGKIIAKIPGLSGVVVVDTATAAATSKLTAAELDALLAQAKSLNPALETYSIFGQTKGLSGLDNYGILAETKVLGVGATQDSYGVLARQMKGLDLERYGILGRPSPEGRAALSGQAEIDATSVVANAAGEGVKKAQQEQVERARRWLDRVETACGMSKAAMDWASESRLIGPNIQDWSRWASERLDKAGCSDNARKELLRDLEKEMHQLTYKSHLTPTYGFNSYPWLNTTTSPAAPWSPTSVESYSTLFASPKQ